MQLISKALKAIDMFGSPIKLNYKKESTVKTQFGGAITILVFFVTVVLFYVFGTEIFFRNKPLITFSKVRRNESSVLLRDFPIIIYVLDHFGGEIRNVHRFVDFYAEQFVITSNATHPFYVNVLNNITFEQCKPEKHYGEYKQLVKENDVSSYVWCMNLGYYSRFHNDYATENSSFVDVSIVKCDNSTRAENNKCAPEKELEEMLNEFYVKVYYPDYYIDPSLYENPETPYLNSNTQRAGLNFFRRNFFLIKTTTIDTDVAILGEDIQTKTLNQLETMNKDMDYSYSANKNIKYTMTWESPKIGDRYQRSYTKIVNVLASMGGLFGLIVSLSEIICSRVSEYSFYFQESKDMINFEPLEESDNQIREMISVSSGNLVSSSSPEDVKIIRFQAPAQVGVNPNWEKVEPSLIKTKKLTGERNNETFNKLGLNLENNKVISMKETSSRILIEVKKQAVSTSSKFKANSGMIDKKKIGFCQYIEILFKYRNTYKEEFYDSIINYFKKQLDIISLIKTHHSVEIMKFLFFNNRPDSDDLFNLKLLPDDITYKYEIDKKNEESQKDRDYDLSHMRKEKRELIEEEAEKKEGVAQYNLMRALENMQKQIASKNLLD